jgi:hypothetical protein
VRAVVSVEGMPSYVEQMILDKLEKKLEVEYGAPMEPATEEPPKKEPPKEQPDDGAPPDEAGGSAEPEDSLSED